ncbi:aspartate/glutamate racemase family protein [Microbacterium sp. 2MCAF23]|uniref:aspartate/glutamate racemase family protein n=1 Tax=Microbacterium sp. 2MCAF23 TaxID=3232985 RepID=UPI003F94364C
MIDAAGGHGHLLVLNPNTTDAVTALIDERVRRALPAGWSAEARSAHWGTPSVETAVDMAIAGLAVADEVIDHRSDGVLVAAFGDPGLSASRELAGVPVVGIGEASTLLAARFGEFAVLTIQPASVPTVRAMLRANGVESGCRRIEALPVPVLAAADPAAVRVLLRDAATRIVEDPHVRSIVLGGGPLGVHAEWLEEECGIPVIDPISAGIDRLIALVRASTSECASPSIDPKPFVGGYDFLERIATRLWAAEQG